MKNIEFKAKISIEHYNQILEYLLKTKFNFIGTDNQTDTYFKIDKGKLKLREGNIEKSLIFYNRENSAEPKRSDVILVKSPDENLKKILLQILDIDIVVKKERKIFLENDIKIHLDKVENLGYFFEIEIIDNKGNKDEQTMKKQINDLMKKFNIQANQLVKFSYSDLLKNQKTNENNY